MHSLGSVREQSKTVADRKYYGGLYRMCDAAQWLNFTWIVKCIVKTIAQRRKTLKLNYVKYIEHEATGKEYDA